MQETPGAEAGRGGGAGCRTLTALGAGGSPAGSEETGLLEESASARAAASAYLLSPGVAAVELTCSRDMSLFLPD